ncbi:hypothetical protein B0T19DRAFT_383414 [Cercophora scortea]|uniref:Uncharacterized protein n=1 Tax=Cercophora scortea TaxID=314031 RepID=A0AAE0J130_9PEZI|nr:hypothetical protein B0T19DRAFT_383414 [Cercophora scortea]
MIINSDSGPVEVTACPDTGSDKNIISRALINDMGLEMTRSTVDTKQFELANGRLVEAVGEVVVSCSFGAGNPHENSQALQCLFFVFSSLAVPIIMGLEFLSETETHTKHRDRLVEQTIPSAQALSVNSVGRPGRNLVCQLGSYVGLASADTGSDLDLVSPQFASTRAFQMESAVHQIQFADGSFGLTSGIIRAQFSVGSLCEIKGFVASGETADREFYVLQNLTSDIIVGQETLEMFDVFRNHADSLIPDPLALGTSDLNIIRYVGKMERKVTKAVKGTTQAFKTIFSWDGSGSVANDLATVPEFLGLEAQRENARRELESQQSSPCRNHHDASAGPELSQSSTDSQPDENTSLFPGQRMSFCSVRGCPRSRNGGGENPRKRRRE